MRLHLLRERRPQVLLACKRCLQLGPGELGLVEPGENRHRLRERERRVGLRHGGGLGFLTPLLQLGAKAGSEAVFDVGGQN